MQLQSVIKLLLGGNMSRKWEVTTSKIRFILIVNICCSDDIVDVIRK